MLQWHNASYCRLILMLRRFYRAKAVPNDRGERFVSSRPPKPCDTKESFIFGAVVGLHRCFGIKPRKSALHDRKIAGDIKRVALIGADACPDPVQYVACLAGTRARKFPQRPAVAFVKSVRVVDVAIKPRQAIGGGVRRQWLEGLRAAEGAQMSVILASMPWLK